MKRFFIILDKVIESINKNIAVFGIFLGTIVNFIVFIFREFHIDAIWMGEVSRQLFIWALFFGMAYGFKKGVHIAVMMLLEKMPLRTGKTFLILAHIITSAYLFFLLYGAIVYIDITTGFNEHIHNMPAFIFLLCVPISLIGATYRALEKVYETIQTPVSEVVFNASEEIKHDVIMKD